MKNETKELRDQLYQICDETATRRSGIEHLVNYYITSLDWTEVDAIKYAINLFHNGTINQIKLFGKDGKEI